MRRDFYVDDGLTSVPTAEQAIALVKASQGIYAKAGLKLHKMSSDKREPVQERVMADARVLVEEETENTTEELTDSLLFY